MKIKNLRWWIIILIALATVINYIDRNSLSVMWPAISDDLGLGKDDYALIVSFFLIAYGIGQLFAGRLFDIIGSRLGFVISILVWSLATAFQSIARGVISLSIIRSFLGLGEGGNFPGATKSNAEWFPMKERALAQGILNTGSSLGAILSAPVIALLYVTFGWRTSFVLIGLVGIVWIIPWLLLNRGSVKKHPFITEEEKRYIIEGQGEQDKTDDRKKVTGVFELLRFKQTWAVMLGRFFLDPVWWMILIWLPIYLNDTFGLDIKSIGLFAWVPYVGAAIGSLSGGFFSGYLIGKGKSVNNARKTAIVLGCTIMFIPIIPLIYANSPMQAVLLMSISNLGFQFAMGNVMTLASDFYSGKTVGTISGMGGFMSVAGVLITTNLVPLITQTSYVPFFILAACLIPLGAISAYIGGNINQVSLK